MRLTKSADKINLFFIIKKSPLYGGEDISLSVLYKKSRRKGGQLFEKSGINLDEPLILAFSC
jgi:hypothetical protein